MQICVESSALSARSVRSAEAFAGLFGFAEGRIWLIFLLITLAVGGAFAGMSRSPLLMRTCFEQCHACQGVDS